MRAWGNSVAVGALAVGLFCGAARAQAQDADTTARTGLDEIVVTATRRETNVQDTPLAITAIGGEELRERGISDPRQLSSLAPSLVVDQGLSEGQTHVSIRGQSSTSFGLEAQSPAAIYLDDVYQAYQFGLGTQVYDMNRIEVLRGPQGTLFGKNTTAGSVNYYSQTPTSEREGYIIADAGGGQFNHYSLEGAFNQPITDDLAFRGSMRISTRDDYISNLADGDEVGGFENYNGRLQLRWTPSDATTVNLKLFGFGHNGDGPIYNARGYSFNPCDPPTGGALGPYFLCDGDPFATSGDPTPVSDNPEQMYSNIDTYENYGSGGATLRIDHDFGGLTLTSISNYQTGDFEMATNDDGMLGDFFHSRQASDTEQMSQEIRLATPIDRNLRAIFGLYGQLDEIYANQSSISSQLNDIEFGLASEYTAPLARGTIETTTYAAFTSVTYDLNSKLSLSGGLRYSYEEKVANFDDLYLNNFAITPGGPIFLFRDITEEYFNFEYALSQFEPAFDTRETFDDSDEWTRTTGDLKLSYTPTEDLLLFASVATGFRSGGFFSAPDGAPEPFVSLRPETVTSYEVGFKSEWLENTVRVNGGVYFTEYNDLQIQTANPNGPGLYFSNAAQAEIQGAELEVVLAPVERLVISTSLGYTDATYKEYVTRVEGVDVDLSGNHLPYAPDWTANVGVSYEIPVGTEHVINLDTNWSYRSELFFDSFEDPITTDESRVIGDLRVGFGNADSTWEIAGYVNNLTDEDDIKAFTFALPGIAPTVYAPGRVWGAQLVVRY